MTRWLDSTNQDSHLLKSGIVLADYLEQYIAIYASMAFKLETRMVENAKENRCLAPSVTCSSTGTLDNGSRPGGTTSFLAWSGDSLAVSELRSQGIQCPWGADLATQWVTLQLMVVFY